MTMTLIELQFSSHCQVNSKRTTVHFQSQRQSCTSTTVQLASPSSFAFNVAASTASISVDRNPAFSSLWSAVIVVPPGEHTSSFSWPGCFPVSSTIFAAPWSIKITMLLINHVNISTECLKGCFHQQMRGSM